MDCLEAQLRSAAEFNDLEAAELLLKEEGIDIYSKDEKGMTVLHILIRKRIEILDSIRSNARGSTPIDVKRNEKFIEMLLKCATTYPNCTDDMRLLNFHAVCTLENCDVAVSLLAKITDVNKSINEKSSIWPGYTCLHFAAHCNVELMKILMAMGGKLLCCDAEGVTPLDICIQSFDVKEVHSILSSVTTWKDILFSDGKSKLMDYIAVLHDKESHIKFLQKTSQAVGMSLPKDSPLWPGYTLLRVAVTFTRDYGDRDVIFDLFAEGADPTARDSRGCTPLHLAFNQGKRSILCVLAHHHKKRVNHRDKDGLSLLHIACAENLVVLVEKLSVQANVGSAYNGRPLVKVKPGWTPLHVACFAEHPMLVDMLLKADADPLKTDVDGFTAIHRLLGADGQKSSILDLMSASKRFKDCVVEGVGLTHLHVMAYWNMAKVVERLLDSGADIEATIGEIEDDNLMKFVGCRPLHFAVMNGHLETVKVLLQRGADVFVKKPNGSYPLLEILAGEYNKSALEPLVCLLWANEDLQRRMEKEIGLTMLHVVCYALDGRIIKDLLVKQVNVNARVSEGSPVWPGFTSLHVLTSLQTVFADGAYGQRRIVAFLQLLLNSGANVTLANADGDTPLHLYHYNLALKYRCRIQVRASSLIKFHHDFSVNPTNKEGLSHFHIACLMCNSAAVNRFLERGVDVNQSISESASEFTGMSPLHLTLSAHAYDELLRFLIVDLLLGRGADVNAVDVRGCTSLHYLSKYFKCGSTRQRLLDRIVTIDTDINKETIDGETPFELLIQSGASMKEIKYYMKRGSRINSYNRKNNRGYLSIVITDERYRISSKGILELMTSSPDITVVDERGRNAIHNCLGGRTKNLNRDDFAALIEKLINSGCDLHQQDREGKTPLHVAVELKESIAVDALFTCGADVNLVDSTGQSPFSYCCKWNESATGVFYYIAAGVIAHVSELQFVGLEVSELNARHLSTYIHLIRDETTLREQVNKTKTVKIGVRGLRLYDFVFEKNVVKIISSFTPEEREIVGTVLEAIDFEKFVSLKHLLKLQYRKVLERLSLVQPAATSLVILLGFPLPDLCVKFVLNFLTNAELKSLVAATIKNDVLEMAIG